MKKFIFISTEGITYQPDSVSPEPDIENMQVMGFGEGDTPQDAFSNFLGLHEYLLKTTFDEIIAVELKNRNRKYFYLSDRKKNYLKAS